MLETNHLWCHSRVCLSPLAVASLLVLALWVLPGCKKHSDDDGHGHGSKPEQKAGANAEGDGHDHANEAAHVDEVKLTAEAVERYGVKVAQAQQSIIRPTFIAPARVAFNTEAMAHVGSPVRGRAVEIKVRLGDQVAPGQELVVVESPELGEAQADYFQKRVAVQSLAPAVELAKVAWDRARGLYEKSEGISLTEVQKREAEYKAALAAQKSAEAMVIGSENRLHILGMTQQAMAELGSSGEIMPRYTIKASIAGQVVQREVTQGELVGPDRPSLMVLADTRTVWVLADVPEARVAGLAVGAKAWVMLGAVKGNRYEGTVAFISPLVDPTTRTAQVRIEVPSTQLTLKPGMFAQVEIVVTSADGIDRAPQVAVPQEAVQTVEGGPAVFVPVEGEPNTFAKRALTIGPTVGGLVPILTGLAEGEKYVEAGSFILKAELGKGSAAHEH